MKKIIQRVREDLAFLFLGIAILIAPEFLGALLVRAINLVLNIEQKFYDEINKVKNEENNKKKQPDNITE